MSLAAGKSGGSWRCLTPLSLWLVAILVSLTTACASPVARTDPQTIALGKQLYQTLACDRCHGLDTIGSTRTYAPTHNRLRATAEQRIRATDYTGKANSAVGYIRESIVEPQIYVVDGYDNLRFGMPSYAHLDERDLQALVQFLYHQQ